MQLGSSKPCKKCGEIKDLSLFAKNKQSRQGRENQCQACRTLSISNRRRGNKLKAIEYKGGACSACGGSFHPCVYDFHHINIKEKEKDPGTLMSSKWETIKKELDKCVLLCANCHRLAHASPRGGCEI